MVGYKKKNQHRRTRKGKGFAGTSRWATNPEETGLTEDENPEVTPDPSTSSSGMGSTSLLPETESDQTSVSRKKLSDHGYLDECEESSDEEKVINGIGPGYRLVDLDTLSSTMFDLHKCDNGT